MAAAAALAAFSVVPGIVMEGEGGAKGLVPSVDSFLALADGCSCCSCGAPAVGVVAVVVLRDDDLRLFCRKKGGGQGGGGRGTSTRWRLGVLRESIRHLEKGYLENREIKG